MPIARCREIESQPHQPCLFTLVSEPLTKFTIGSPWTISRTRLVFSPQQYFLSPTTTRCRALIQTSRWHPLYLLHQMLRCKPYQNHTQTMTPPRPLQQMSRWPITPRSTSPPSQSPTLSSRTRKSTEPCFSNFQPPSTFAAQLDNHNPSYELTRERYCSAWEFAFDRDESRVVRVEKKTAEENEKTMAEIRDWVCTF
jgi:hypothetical protein